MKGFTEWMEKNFVPIAAKIGSQRHLVAIRDAFISIMPITMAGSIAVLFNVFFRDLPTTWGMTGFVQNMQFFIGIDGRVWWGTIGIIALAFVFALGYKVAESYDVNPLAGGLVVFAAFMTTIPEATEAIGGWGYYQWSYTNANALFTALFVGLVGGVLFSKLMKTNLTIKMPDSVPPAVGKAFASIIPGTITIFLFGLISLICQTYIGMPLNDLVSKFIQTPFLNLSQGYGAILLITLAVQIFWSLAYMVLMF